MYCFAPLAYYEKLEFKATYDETPFITSLQRLDGNKALAYGTVEQFLCISCY